MAILTHRVWELWNFTIWSWLESSWVYDTIILFRIIADCLWSIPDFYHLKAITDLSFRLQSHLFDLTLILNLSPHSQSNLIHHTVILNLPFKFFFHLKLIFRVHQPIVNIWGTFVWQSLHYREEMLNLSQTTPMDCAIFYVFHSSSRFMIGSP